MLCEKKNESCVLKLFYFQRLIYLFIRRPTSKKVEPKNRKRTISFQYSLKLFFNFFSFDSDFIKFHGVNGIVKFYERTKKNNKLMVYKNRNKSDNYLNALNQNTKQTFRNLKCLLLLVCVRYIFILCMCSILVLICKTTASLCLYKQLCDSILKRF